MNDYVMAEHIQNLIESQRIERLDSSFAKAAEAHLIRSFPMSSGSTILDWDRIPSRVLSWNTVTDDGAAAWTADTIAGHCTFGLLLFASNQPCLIGPFEFMIRNLDELVWKAPGCRILFGVERNRVGDIEFTRGVVEFNGRGELFASIES
jgi:hypothetical protein